MTAGFYLDLINPLRGLGQTELISQIELGQRGFLARLQWLYYFIEKRDPMVRATKRRLLSALGGLDWNIKRVDTGGDAQKKAIAEAQAKTLGTAYDAIGNLRAALNFLCLADLRGYSHLEKIYQDDDPSGIITELRIVEQWFWCRIGKYGRWQYNNSAFETDIGQDIDYSKFIIREVEDPADEIFAELAVKRKVNDQDWDGFLEDYGVPPMFIVGPPNIPADKEKEYQRVAQETVSRRRGYLPYGAALKSPSVSSSGETKNFRTRLEYLDEQIVVAGTSGKLTILAASGAGTLAGQAQKQAFDELAESIAKQVAGVLQQQFDKPLLARVHPGEPILAYFEFARVEAEDTSTILTDAKNAANAGFAMDAQELSEKTGYKLRRVVQ